MRVLVTNPAARPITNAPATALSGFRRMKSSNSTESAPTSLLAEVARSTPDSNIALALSVNSLVTAALAPVVDFVLREVIKSPSQF